MRAFTLDSFDTPRGLREDLPTPQVGPDQLLVRVQASSVNPVDAFIAAGVLKAMAEHEFPVALGRDYAGVVEQVGPAVTGYGPGRRGVRVAAACQPHGPRGQLGRADGGPPGRVGGPPTGQ